jgi:hypothetical protein
LPDAAAAADPDRDPFMPERFSLSMQKRLIVWLVCACLGCAATACQTSGRIPILVMTTPSATPAAAALPGEVQIPPATDAATMAAGPTEAMRTAEPPGAQNRLATGTYTPQASATLTHTAGPSPTASRTATPTATPTRTRWPTVTRTLTRTPIPPAAAMRIARPGALSKVTSPFRVEAVIRTGDDGKAWLHLIGEDGRIISQQALDFGRQANQQFFVSPLVHFEIAAAAETARLVISSMDRHGRTAALTSVELILMKTGASEIFQAPESLEPYLVQSPRNEAVISGGVAQVSGLMRPLNDSSVLFELIDAAGQVVGSAELAVPPADGNSSYTPFQVSILYQVSATTPVRLTVRQESEGRIAGTVALWSMLLTLRP